MARPIRDSSAIGPSGARILLVIAVGGFIGTLGRYGLGLAWSTRPGQFPAATLTINTSGAFLLALLLTAIGTRRPHDEYLRPFAGIGILGAWTTMSTLAVDANLLAKDGHVLTAAAYLLATLAAGLIAIAAGTLVARLILA